MDLHDGMGLRNGSGRLDLLGKAGATWALAFSMSNIPQKYADSEAATLKAVVASYRRNEGVISAENAAVMDRIRQQGIANEEQAKAINANREANKQSFDNHMQTLRQNDAENDQHMANIDWQSKITQDYILDRSVVNDAEYDDRATVGNKFADSLVQTNPNRFEIVQNQDLIRGRSTRPLSVILHSAALSAGELTSSLMRILTGSRFFAPLIPRRYPRGPKRAALRITPRSVDAALFG